MCVVCVLCVCVCACVCVCVRGNRGKKFADIMAAENLGESLEESHRRPFQMKCGEISHDKATHTTGDAVCVCVCACVCLLVCVC